MAYRLDRLENGLRVVTVEKPHLHSLDLTLYFKVGSRNDPDHKKGIAHFLEHMLFRGTQSYPSSLELEVAFEVLGGTVNAATDADSTCFYARIQPEELVAGMRVISSMVTEPLLEDVAVERHIILEEALEDIGEHGDEINPDVVVSRLLWPNHPLGEPVIGDSDGISNIDTDDLRQHLSKWYVPANAVLVGVGPVRHEQVLEAATDLFGGWQDIGTPETMPFPDEPLGGPVIKVVQEGASQMMVQVAFRGLSRRDEALPVLKVLRRVLAGGGSSRLHLALRERLGLVYAVDVTIGSYDETGCLAIDFSTAPDKLEQALKTLGGELALLCSVPVSDDELARVKKVYGAELAYSQDSVVELGARYGWGELMGVVRDIEDEQHIVEAVNGSAVRLLANELFTLENLVVAVIGPVDAVSSAMVAEWLSEALDTGAGATP